MPDLSFAALTRRPEPRRLLLVTRGRVTAGVVARGQSTPNDRALRARLAVALDCSGILSRDTVTQNPTHESEP